MNMYIALYKKKKIQGFIKLVNSGFEYTSELVKEKYSATCFKDDYSLARGLKIVYKKFNRDFVGVECF